MERVGECLFHWRSEEPATRDDLQQALTANAPTRGCLRRLLRRQPPPVAPAPWLPAELLPIESVSNTILEHLDKGHTVADASNAVR